MITDIIEHPNNSKLSNSSAYNTLRMYANNDEKIITCPECRGRGVIIPLGGRTGKECKNCGGKGRLDVFNDKNYWTSMYDAAKLELVQLKVKEMELLRQLDVYHQNLQRLTKK